MAISLNTFKSALQSLFSATPSRQPTEKELVADLAQQSEPFAIGPVTGTRRGAGTSHKLDYSVDGVAAVLRRMHSGTNLQEYVAMAATVLRRNAKLRSVMTTRVLAVTGLPRIVEPGGKKLKDKKAAEACQALANTPHFKKLLRHLMWGKYFGWQGAQAMYGQGTALWPIENFKLLPPEWFAFDPADNETPMLLPAEVGQNATYLEPVGKFVFHTPQLLPGNPYLNGLAYTAVFYAVLGLIVLDSGSQYVELYGQPLRIGKFPPGDGGPAAEAARKVLRKALEGLGRDSWAMIPETMKIEFLKDATGAGGVDVYEKWSRYLDELLAQLVLGASLSSGTGNTGSGGSQALGVVHNELRADLMRSDAEELADTVVRDVFTFFVRWNFGEDVAIPAFHLHIEEAEDVTALSDAVAKLVPLGLKVSQEELRDRLGLSTPAEGEDILAVTTPAQPADAAALTKQENSARSRFAAEAPAGAGDELDDLLSGYLADEGYTRAEADLTEQLLSAISTAKTADDLVQALAAFAGEANVDSMRDHLTGLMLTARAAGEMGVDIGGK